MTSTGSRSQADSNPSSSFSSTAPFSTKTWANHEDFLAAPRKDRSKPTAAGKASIENKRNMGTEDAAAAEGGEVINALIILNTDCISPLFYRFWENTVVRVCADGGANRLYDGLQTEAERRRYIPQYIKGDLDSLRPDVAAYYRQCGTKVIKDSDQDTNDLEKCLELIKEEEDGEENGTADNATNSRNKSGLRQPNARSRRMNVFVLGSLGLRFDHAMANCHLLYRYEGVFRRLVLLGNESTAFLLTPGKHHIKPDVGIEGPVCGLIPLAQPCRCITTQGLKWNLQRDAMAFGGLVSTSNEFVDTRGGAEASGAESSSSSSSSTGDVCVTIDTSDPIIWTTTIKDKWRKHTLDV